MVPVLTEMEMKFTPRKTKWHFCIPDFVTGKSVCGTSPRHLVTGNDLVIPSTLHQLLLGLAGGGAGKRASYGQGGGCPDFTSFQNSRPIRTNVYEPNCTQHWPRGCNKSLAWAWVLFFGTFSSKNTQCATKYIFSGLWQRDFSESNMLISVPKNQV